MEATRNTKQKPPVFDPTKLGDVELFWGNHQGWLKECGYQLRPRYLPGWKASWLADADKIYFLCEDGQIPTLVATMLDATRIADGEPVMLKLITQSIHPYEADIAQYLTSQSDPKNHCVPTYEVLKVPDVDDKIILVMPLLRMYNRPHFQTIGESVDYFQQVIEGLQFMHKHHVAHRDCNGANIMMDGSMYPDGWHPCRDYMKPDFSDEAKFYSRTEKPPRYYFIDFGLSRRYDPEDHLPKEIPILGGDKTVPEFRKSVQACDPFPIDVYYLGNMIRKDFIQQKSGLGFMKTLVDDMVQDDPTKRPTMDQVVERFNHIRNDLTKQKLRARLADREEGAFSVMFRSLSHLGQRVRYTLTGLPAIPSR